MFAGGIADKLGNRYEAKWAVRQLLDVFSGEADALQHESIDPAAAGFEFSVERDGRTEWHQTKINGPNGNWTINALNREGVLDAFRKRLATSNTDICIFVSQDPAKDARDLSEEARTATTLQEYEGAIAGGKIERFREIQTKWAIDAETAFGWLRRCEFRTESEQSIESITSHLSALYFGINTDTVVAVLSDFLIKRLNVLISTEYIRTELHNEQILAIKDWKLDPTLKECLKIETSAYLDTYTPFGVGGFFISRVESKNLFKKTKDPDGPSIILLTGVAGSGKSGVVREYISKLEEHGIPHLAIRIDQHLNCASPRALGEDVTGRNESPAVTLKGLFPDQRAVLIVDQLDAVSEISGRDGRVRDGVLRLVDEVLNFRTLVLVLACRTFDIETDQRLKVLRDTKDIEHIDVQLLSWEDNIEPLLERKGITTSHITEAQKTLLSLPLNLSIFFEVSGDGFVEFRSRNDLFRSLVERKSRIIRARNNVSWELFAALNELAAWMSEEQRLNAPEDVLVQYAGAVDILSSENLIIRSRGYVNFFHESFFDYAFARGFARRKQSLVSLLTSAEQQLFRRTQVRQILETLRQTDEPRYLRELQEVLHGESVRYHIKVAVAQWLGSLTAPNSSEREIAFSLDDAGDHFPPLVRYSIFSSTSWFDCLVADGWLAEVLNSGTPERARTVLWWLSVAAGERPNNVAELLDAWWRGVPEKGDRLIEWFSTFTHQKADAALAELFCRVIRSKPPSLFLNLKGTDRQLFFHNWTGENTSGAATVLSAYFDAWFEAHPNMHPFDNDEITELGLHALGELAKKSPEAFIDGTLDTFVRTIALINERETAGRRQYTFLTRAFSGPHFREDEFLVVFRSCLSQVAINDSLKAREILSQINPCTHEVCTHLWLETIKANAAALADLLAPLTDSPHLYEAGWDGADWKSFADAAKEAIPFLSDSDTEKVENKILSSWPEIDSAQKECRELKSAGPENYFNKKKAVNYLTKSGHEQWCVLETIGETRLSAPAQTRLSQLRRKFTHGIISEPDHNKVHLVGSPIKREKASRMKDRHWLRAIAQYNDANDRRRGQFYTDGGARELARELQELTKLQPVRFATFLLKIPFDSHPTYVGHILSGLTMGSCINDALLEQVVRCSHAWPNRPFGSEIGSLFKWQPHMGSNEDLFKILAWYVEHGDANTDEAIDLSDTDREIVSVDDLLRAGQGLHVRGINGSRGWAAEALGAVIWQVPDVVDRAWDILERRAEIEPMVSVRCCLINPAAALFNHDQKRCAALVDRLSSPFDRIDSTHVQQTKWWGPLTTSNGVSIHRHILFSVPNVGRKLICRLLRSGDESARAFGAWHVFQLSFHENRYARLANVLAKSGEVYRRLFANVASYAIVEEEYRYRAEGVLRACFNDPDKQVRHQAATVFRNIKPTEFSRFKSLAHDFVISNSFDGNAWPFFHCLTEANCNVVDIAISAAEKVIAEIKVHGSQGGRRATELHQLQEIICENYVVSEGNPELRCRLLNIIDDMLGLELHGVDAIIGTHER